MTGVAGNAFRDQVSYTSITPATVTVSGVVQACGAQSGRRQTFQSTAWVGYGSRFTASNLISSGTSFDAIGIPQIEQLTNVALANNWSYIDCIVRAGATGLSHNGGGSGNVTVARGRLEVNPRLFTLENLVIPLFTNDTYTTAKTVASASDFAGKDEVFVAFWGVKSDGTRCNIPFQPVGVTPNWISCFVLASAATDPVTGTWSANGSSTGTAISLLLMSGRAKSYDKPSPILERVVSEQRVIRGTPPEIFGVHNLECNVYYTGLLGSQFRDHLFEFEQPAQATERFDLQDERMTATPGSTAITSERLRMRVRDPFSNQVTAVADFNYRTSVTSGYPSKTPDVIVIGDSRIALTGEVITHMSTLATADAAFKPVFRGHVATTGGSHGSVSGASVNYFSTDGASPYVSAGAFNFSNYLSANSVTFGASCAVVISLGANDIIGCFTDQDVDIVFKRAVAQMETMITQIRAVQAAAVIVIDLAYMGADDYAGFASQYDTTPNRNTFERCLRYWNHLLRTYFTAHAGYTAGTPWLFIGQSAIAMNTDLGYSTTTVAAHSRTSTTVVRKNQAVHPNTDGYEQVGDAMWAVLRWAFR
jgi:lysophospholipase L1-like esterase